MIVQLNIEDKILSEKISDYMEMKHQKINDLIIESLESFLSKSEKRLDYQVEDIEKNSSVIDFGLDGNVGEEVKKYLKELRYNAWR